MTEMRKQALDLFRAIRNCNAVSKDIHAKCDWYLTKDALGSPFLALNGSFLRPRQIRQISPR